MTFPGGWATELPLIISPSFPLAHCLPLLSTCTEFKALNVYIGVAAHTCFSGQDARPLQIQLPHTLLPTTRGQIIQAGAKWHIMALSDSGASCKLQCLQYCMYYCIILPGK